jgi:hypothetical protein
MTMENRSGRSNFFNSLQGEQHNLGKLGKSIAINLLGADHHRVLNDIKAIRDKMVQIVTDDMGLMIAEKASRPIFNHAAVAFGLTLLKEALQRVFGDKFDERVNQMQDYLINSIADKIPNNMDEGSKALNVMALLTRVDNHEWQLVEGRDYTLSEDGRYLDMKLRNVYAIYVRYQRAHGAEVLFDNETAFITAMGMHEACVKRTCPDNKKLFDSPRAIIHRFNTEKLLGMGVDTFR